MRKKNIEKCHMPLIFPFDVRSNNIFIGKVVICRTFQVKGNGSSLSLFLAWKSMNVEPRRMGEGEEIKKIKFIDFSWFHSEMYVCFFSSVHSTSSVRCACNIRALVMILMIELMIASNVKFSFLFFINSAEISKRRDVTNFDENVTKRNGWNWMKMK